MKSILVVEDDAATRHLLRSVLKGAGYSVVTAADGKAGLRRLRQARFDLALLDIWMPLMNGLELLARMRAEGLAAKAVVMTSDGTPETLLRAIREQAYHYLNKPVQPKELLELLEGALAASPVPPIEVLSARPEWVELLAPCEIGTAERIQSFMTQLKVDLPGEVRESVGLVFREMLMNAIEWGGRLDPNRKVRIACLRLRRALIYRIADPGPGFRIEDLTHAAVGHSGDQPTEHVRVRMEKGLRPGGFGILMARAMVDELIYNEARNEVVFVKYLD
jgi:CheY-like chemotaxis protein/anti-sigma regulatory factor (Ser/Thr protein kinase)